MKTIYALIAVAVVTLVSIDFALATVNVVPAIVRETGTGFSDVWTHDGQALTVHLETEKYSTIMVSVRSGYFSGFKICNLAK